MPRTSAVCTAPTYTTQKPTEMLTTPVTSTPTSTATWDPWLDPRLQYPPASSSQADSTFDSYMHVPVSTNTHPGPYMQVSVSATSQPQLSSSAAPFPDAASWSLTDQVTSSLDPPTGAGAPVAQDQPQEHYFQARHKSTETMRTTPRPVVSTRAPGGVLAPNP
ncbi:hypothetical protein EK21DRAFT_90499 [Setomelanomma holmii]|uniref:Uncharacterized protein n=1 Tax=Setomelanomma holmii TaxID=210430 RepID=A0A9P4LJ16_9PLEO|nr:hypothetical protein EK21DRAFT_90499 [Setomelanomma holmii]